MYYETDYLAHHGVKGMKWGVRHDPESTGKQRRGVPTYAEALNGYDRYQQKVTKALGGANNRTNAYATQAIARTIKSNKPSNMQKALYTARVLRIAKKDNKTKREKLKINDKDTAITKAVKTDYNNLSDLEFRARYQTSKDKYAKRVAKSRSGDPLKTGKAAVAAILNANEALTTVRTGKTTAERADDAIAKSRQRGAEFANMAMETLGTVRVKDLNK